MSREIHLSNRASDPRNSAAVAGGLDNTLKSGNNIVRIAWSGNVIEDGSYNYENPEVHCERFSHTSANNKTTHYVLVDLPATAQKIFYENSVNEISWPAQHGKPYYANIGMGRNALDVADVVQAYDHINDIFAKVLKSEIGDRDTVIAHDSHLARLGYAARREGINNPIGLMFHIPMYTQETLNHLDDEIYGFVMRTLKEDLFEFDMVGLQAPWDLTNLQEILGEEPSSGVDSYTTRLISNGNGKQVLGGVFPATSDKHHNRSILNEFSGSVETELLLSQAFPEGGRSVDMVGADRLDYTKGLPERIQALRLCVEKFDADPRSLHLIQAAASSRESVYGYAQEKASYGAEYHGLRSDYGNVVFTPFDKTDPTKSLPVKQGIIFNLYRRSRVGIFASGGPEGMHLGAAGEYLDCQDPNNPGVMLMTNKIGAAHDYKDAGVIVDPEPLAIAEGMMRARQMPRDERIELYQIGLKVRESRTNGRWLAALTEATKEGAENRASNDARPSITLER